MSCPNVQTEAVMASSKPDTRQAERPAPQAGQPYRGSSPLIDADLMKKEMERIVQRRSNAPPAPRKNAPAPAASDASPDAVRGNLVGLALSGGGIRSASFNLGLLQAFYQAGLFRHLDYLSTVSGGSYIGGWLSCQISQLKGHVTPDNLPLRKDRGVKEEPAVTRLIRAGHYLSHPLLLANRYCFGLVKTNLIVGSLLLLLCAVTALVWRLLDEPPLCETILVLTGGVLIEAFRPFMVAIILLLTWLIGWLIAAPKRERLSQPMIAVISVLLAVVTFVWPMLEWAYEGLVLPEHLLWRIVRPLPLLLLIAWVLAWTLMTPIGKPIDKKAQDTAARRPLASLPGSPRRGSTT